MRTIERSTAFKRDYKRILAQPRHSKDMELRLFSVLRLLLTDQPLPSENRDHALIGNWSGYRECHLKPDLLLIYRNTDSNILRLARLGSHSDLF